MPEQELEDESPGSGRRVRSASLPVLPGVRAARLSDGRGCKGRGGAARDGAGQLTRDGRARGGAADMGRREGRGSRAGAGRSSPGWEPPSWCLSCQSSNPGIPLSGAAGAGRGSKEGMTRARGGGPYRTIVKGGVTTPGLWIPRMDSALFH